MALGHAVALLGWMENRARHRSTGDRHRVAPPWLPTLVDVEESTPNRGTDDVRRHPPPDSHDGRGEPAMGCAADPRRTPEAWNRCVPDDRRDVHGACRRPPSQTWRTFLSNHVGQIVAADFFVVPTVTFRLVFVLVLLAHDRRRIRHVAVTMHPTAAWTAQQLREALPWDEAPRYLIHDCDHAFAALGTTMGIEDVVTAPHAP